jgi:response regulator RpfG family c-di-GMP phosphodiesterase
MKSLAPVLPIIRHHHERWDGSGYPDGLRHEQIPVLARVVQMVDIYDALTNARPYKVAYTPDQALQIMKEETERGWRDPEIASVFFDLHDEVLSKIATYANIDKSERRLEGMRQSLCNLHHYLATADLPDVPALIRPGA